MERKIEMLNIVRKFTQLLEETNSTKKLHSFLSVYDKKGPEDHKFQDSWFVVTWRIEKSPTNTPPPRPTS